MTTEFCYLDAFAATPMDPRVVNQMTSALKTCYANASNQSNEAGQAAAQLLDQARDEVRALLGWSGAQVVFTGSCTEANNMAVRTVVDSIGEGQFYVSSIEHKSVLEPATTVDHMKRCALGCGNDGVLEIGPLGRIHESSPGLSAMAVNNETAIVQPLKHITEIVKGRGTVWHCDITQAIGKLPLDFLKADGAPSLVTFSAHKFHGPKGVGVLAINPNTTLEISEVVQGGGQEQGKRAGTENVPAVVAAGYAMRIIAEEELEVIARLRTLTDFLFGCLITHLNEFRVVGEFSPRVPGCLAILIPGVEAAAIMNGLARVALSSGSACSRNGEQKTSHVLRAMGFTEAEAGSCLRLSIHRFTTEAEIDAGIRMLAKTVAEYQNVAGAYDG